MHNGHIESAAEGSAMVNGSTGNTPPIWHQMAAAPVVFRSLFHEPNEARAHNHESAELILNFGKEPGSIVWRDTLGAEQTTELRGEDCCLIPAGVTHLVSGLRTQGVVSLLVGGVLMAEIARRNLATVVVENLRQLAVQDSMVGGLAAEFGRVISRQPHLVNTLGFALGLKLLHSILYRETGFNQGHLSFCLSEQRRAVEYLKAHLTDRVKVAELARRLGLSRAHFTRRFRATFGMSPHQYALKMRVDHALELLRGGEYRVAEAAYAVGFYDQSHFDRHCRKFYGRSPSTFHRNVTR